MKKCYKVKFKQTGQSLYFHSIQNIFKNLTTEQVGISKGMYYHVHRYQRLGDMYESPNCFITIVPIQDDLKRKVMERANFRETAPANNNPLSKEEAIVLLNSKCTIVRDNCDNLLEIMTGLKKSGCDRIAKDVYCESILFGNVENYLSILTPDVANKLHERGLMSDGFGMLYANIDEL